LATPLLMAALSLPPDVDALRAGDVDGDGRDELIMICRHDGGTDPDAIDLTIVHFDSAGNEEGRDEVKLGTTARFWDIQDGLWAVDGQGISRLGLDGTVDRVATLTTPLAGLGPTTPVAADIAHDLDHDGVADVLAFSSGVLHVVDASGRAWGALAAPSEGALATRTRAGATGLGATQRSPSVAVADMDGDGLDDILLPERDELRVALTRDVAGAEVHTSRLPLDLEPDDRNNIDQDKEERRVAGTWIDDFDGDGRADLLVQRMVTRGSWFGSTAELYFAPGDGSRFVHRQSVETDAAAVDLIVVDYDGDGDKDVVIPQVDVNMGNLASALLAKVVKVDLTLFLMEEGRLSEEPIRLRRLRFPLDAGDRMQLEGHFDLTGDGIVDLVTNDGEDVLRVYPGSLDGFAEDPSHERAVTIPPGEDHLFAHDLTGDGRAELVVWGQGQASGHVLRVP